MTVTIQIRRDTAANWTSSNPTLAIGEMGLEMDTQKFKVGDGVTAWSSLGYWLAGGGGGGREIGEIMMWATDTPPSGWLLCYGQAVSRSTYSDLFAVVGTTFGVGDGSTTFDLPDMRGRFPLGQDDMGGTPANRVTDAQADSIGGSGGAESHTLTTAEMPSHSHGNYYRPLALGGTYRNTIYPWGSAYQGASTGGGGAHNNMPPYLTLNYIIYAGV